MYRYSISLMFSLGFLGIALNGLNETAHSMPGGTIQEDEKWNYVQSVKLQGRSHNEFVAELSSIKVNKPLPDYEGDTLVLCCGHLDINSLDINNLPREVRGLSRPLETHMHTDSYTLDLLRSDTDLIADLFDRNTLAYLKLFGTQKFQRIMYELPDFRLFNNHTFHRLVLELLKPGGYYLIPLSTPNVARVESVLYPFYLQTKMPPIKSSTSERDSEFFRQHYIDYYKYVESKPNGYIFENSMKFDIPEFFCTNSYYNETIDYYKSLGFESVQVGCLHFPYFQLTTTFTKTPEGVTIDQKNLTRYMNFPIQESCQNVQNLTHGINTQHNPVLIARKALPAAESFP